MFMAIAEEIFRMTGYKKGDRLVEAMMIGIFWVAQGAMAYTPISHVLIPMIFEYIAADFGITITYTRYTIGFLLAGSRLLHRLDADTPLYYPPRCREAQAS